MIDRNSTARDWNMARTDVIFFPVGAFEQHGAHLPLDTDCRLADYFARVLAEHFNGALLPVQCIASSLEHTGWRGAFSLKPETLINVVRDVAEEAQRQNYRYMVVVSGHGGNFPLGPAIREWNRRDQKLKILLVYPFGYAHALDEPGKMDLHAGKNETSVLMHICNQDFMPAEDFPPGNQSGILRQSDLNTFGIGRLNSAGVPGYPAEASRELGSKLVGIMSQKIIEEVESRIAMLEENPRFCGRGGLYIRQCDNSDIPNLLEQFRAVNWQVPAENLERVLQYGELWSMIHLNRIVGTAGFVKQGRRAWIVLVSTRSEWRKCGIASELMKKIIERTQGFGEVMLDASTMGENVYRKLGFQECGNLHLYEIAPGSAPEAPELDWQPVRKEDFPLPGCRADNPATEWIFESAPERCFAARCGGRIVSWFTAREKGNVVHIGPVYAENAAMALDALKQARKVNPARTISLDIFTCENELLEKVKADGGVLKQTHCRMYRGEKFIPRAEDNIRTSAGPDLG